MYYRYNLYIMGVPCFKNPRSSTKMLLFMITRKYFVDIMNGTSKALE